ncbi:putative ABC transport system ATP-binding protein/lipoprotein-releasing system ATP-binding protein [Mariniphaga anaerophila]|uniref:Putative ABC transport system ATP-binding protein/lipoprotein-releasing system ATP-binding protein n=1 Tax=Mariniphaga anaerophila TaxID=1484053 RepID=A0A1M5DQC8_9BACT|nr:ABC transporter ATP-binding protein [Mariniphaga anaerophila]SHF69199.1 putative ABC transport system ATP-binding protein/lipoprotein-releasing system ATP-binding protein [Mariniphaga anaerophila]
MLLQLQNITKGYGEPGSHSYRAVLNKLDLQVASGEKIAIVGPSGSGKTTLLNLVGALDQPEQGDILFEGKDITGYSTAELATFRNKHLGFVFQLHHLMPQLSLMENVLLPLLPQGKGISKEQKEWAEYLIRKVGIWEQRDQKPSQLSGGECQRTAVVRALMNKPKLLLADEPTGALDEENAKELTELLVKLSNEEGVTLVAVTHAAALADRMDKKYLLKNGKLV